MGRLSGLARLGYCGIGRGTGGNAPLSHQDPWVDVRAGCFSPMQRSWVAAVAADAALQVGFYAAAEAGQAA